MPFTLTSDDRIAMSRRLVKVDNEIDFFTEASTNNTSDAAIFEQTDDMNKVFMDFYNDIAGAYEDEKRALNGTVAATFDESDVLASARETVGNIFYPNDFDTGSPNNPNLIPGSVDTDVPSDGISDGLVDEVNGSTISTDSYYESNLINFPPVAAQNSGDGVAQLIDILTSGFTPSSSASTTLASDYTAGSGTMVVTSGTNIANGDYLLVTKTTGSLSALFMVKAGGGTTTLTVYEICAPTGNIVVPVLPTPNDTTVVNTFSGFSNSDRQSLTASTAIQQNVLDRLTTTGTNCLINKVLSWETKVTDENTAISGNEEERVTQAGQLTSATSANTTTLGVINTWQALSNTGASGKFVNSSLSTLDTHVTSRITTVSTRLTQISTALGSVSDNADGTVTFSSDEAIYPKRWSALNYRINRGMGSLKKKVGLEANTNMLDGMLDFLESSKTDYEGRMTATKFASNPDGSSQIEVVDASGFALDDAIYVVSETQAELSGTVRSINNNTVVLSFRVGTEYTLDELARLYKVL